MIAAMKKTTFGPIAIFHHHSPFNEIESKYSRFFPRRV
jgi:hypothetical protein